MGPFILSLCLFLFAWFLLIIIIIIIMLSMVMHIIVIMLYYYHAFDNVVYILGDLYQLV